MGSTLAVGTGVGAGDGVAGVIGPGALGVCPADDAGPGPSDTDWVRWISGTEGGALVDSGVVGTGSGFQVAELAGTSCIANAGRYPGSVETGGSVSTIRATTMETASPTNIPMNVWLAEDSTATSGYSGATWGHPNDTDSGNRLDVADSRREVAERDGPSPGPPMRWVPIAAIVSCPHLGHGRWGPVRLAARAERSASMARGWRPRHDWECPSRTDNRHTCGAGPSDDARISCSTRCRTLTQRGRSATPRVPSSSLTPLSA